MKRNLTRLVITVSSCLLLAALSMAAFSVPGPMSLAAPAAACPDFYWQNPLPQGNNLNDIEALADDAAIAVGDNGVILKTVDASGGWAALASGVEADLYGVSSADSGTIWVTGGGGTILKTTDGGATWVQQASPTGTDINDVCAVSSNVAWAVADGDMSTGGIPLLTTDGGDTWEMKLDPAETFSLLTGVNAIGAEDAWICGPGTVAKTADGGATWDSGAAPIAGYINRVRMFDTDTAVAVGNSGAFMRTDNGGADWELKDTGVDFELYSLSFLDDQTGWIVGDNGYVARTTDGGDSWDVQDSGRPDSLLGVAARDADHVWACGFWGSLLLTENGGSSWWKLDSGKHDGLFGLSLVGDRTLWAVGFDSTILKSCDGGNNWATQVPPQAVDYFGVSASSLNQAWAVGGNGTIVHTTDGGDSWESQVSGVTANLYGVEAASDSIVWAGGSEVLLKTEDGGAAWKPVSNLGLYGDISAEAVDPLTAWAYGGGGTVEKTVDGGVTWQEQTLGMTGYDVLDVTCLSALSSNVAYATAVIQKTDALGDFSVVFRTVDGGATWSNTYPAGGGELDLFAVTVADADTAWAGGLYGTVVKTEDGGNTWVRQQSLTDNIVNAMVSNGSHTAWLVARGGNILRTTDPVAYAATPSQGLDTDTTLPFKVEGLGFAEGMTVELVRSGQPAIVGSAVNVVSSREAVCEFDLSGAAEGAWDVVVTNPNGLLFTLDGFFQVVSATRWYLPEGSTGVSETGSFETWVLLQNPGDTEAAVKLTYLTSGGEVAGPTVPVPAHGRATVNVAETVPGDWSVATVAESEQAIVAESSLYWNQAGGNYRQACGESLGLPALASRWYLPEGSTGSSEAGSFETWVLLGNPGTQAAKVDIYLPDLERRDGGPGHRTGPGNAPVGERGGHRAQRMERLHPGGERRIHHGGTDPLLGRTRCRPHPPLVDLVHRGHRPGHGVVPGRGFHRFQRPGQLRDLDPGGEPR